MSTVLEVAFPRLTQGNYSVTSPRSKRYNCIAWAAANSGNWWWPGPNAEEEYWPSAVARVESLDAFREAFASFGYDVCQGEDFEPGFEKTAFFADEKHIPQHAARQLPNGRWTSKLGLLEDIEHALRDLEGPAYGTVVLVMKRPVEQRVGT